MIISVKPWQFQKASSPIVRTLLGIVIDDVKKRWEKAASPIEVTVLGIIVLIPPAINSFVLVFMMALQLSRESYSGFPSSTFITDNSLQLRYLQVFFYQLFTS